MSRLGRVARRTAADRVGKSAEDPEAERVVPAGKIGVRTRAGCGAARIDGPRERMKTAPPKMSAYTVSGRSKAFA